MRNQSPKSLGSQKRNSLVVQRWITVNSFCATVLSTVDNPSTTPTVTHITGGTATITVTSAIDATKYASLVVQVTDGTISMSSEAVDQNTADSR